MAGFLKMFDCHIDKNQLKQNRQYEVNKLIVVLNLIICGILWVLLNPPTTAPPTTDHQPTDLLTH